jgi:site-specific DNA recombinase
VNDNGELQLKQLVESYFAEENSDEVNPKTLRYAMYVRKSTESAERQARSIPDQIEDCYDGVINPLGIDLQRKDIFREERSAKEAGTRPVFRKLIQAIEAGRYDAIISWHPDRLARNMKDAGEIIDLIDRNIIKDMRFARAHFENTPNGKMTLGISFVLSKHYSEHLSESVNRGNRRITEKGGVLNKFKHGYKVTPDNRLVADGDNFLLIQEAFEMRKGGDLGY